MATPLLALLCCALAWAEPTPEVGCADAEAELQSLPVSLVQKGWMLGRPTSLALASQRARQPAEVAEQPEAPTEQPAEAPAEAPTEAPTELPTETPTEAPTEPPTEAQTEATASHESEPEDAEAATWHESKPEEEEAATWHESKPEEAATWHESKPEEAEAKPEDAPCMLHAIWNAITWPLRAIWNAIYRPFYTASSLVQLGSNESLHATQLGSNESLHAPQAPTWHESKPEEGEAATWHESKPEEAEAATWHESKPEEAEAKPEDAPCMLHTIWNAITWPLRAIWNAIYRPFYTASSLVQLGSNASLHATQASAHALNVSALSHVLGALDRSTGLGKLLTRGAHHHHAEHQATPGALSLLSMRMPNDVYNGMTIELMFVTCVMGIGFVGAVCIVVYFLSPCFKHLTLELQEPYYDDQYREPAPQSAAVLTTKRVAGPPATVHSRAPLHALGRELKTQHGSLPTSGVGAVGAPTLERALPASRVYSSAPAACEPTFDPVTTGYFQPAPTTSPHLGGAGAALMRGQRFAPPSSETRLLPPRVLQAERRG